MSRTARGRQHTSVERRGRAALALAALVLLSPAAAACGGGGAPAAAKPSYRTVPQRGDDRAGHPQPDGSPERADGDAPGCAASGLDIKGFSQAPDGSDPVVARKTLQQHTSVGMKNTSGRACVLEGFPGAAFVGGAEKDPEDGRGTKRWVLPRSEESARPVTLRPGERAWVPLTFLSEDEDADEDGWYPKKVEITPPGGTRPVVLDWPWGNVLRQDGSSRSGTFVHPVSARSGSGH